MADGQTYDFVIVGSGAGRGFAGSKPCLSWSQSIADRSGWGKNQRRQKIPSSVEFYVKHYSDDNRPERDPKYHSREARLPGSPGIFYHRATGLGGCTIHHAMITVYPHESDWDAIADLVGDGRRRAENMRKYFDRLERAHYRDDSVLLDLLQLERIVGDSLRRLTESEHGEGARGPQGAGWLSVTQADPLVAAARLSALENCQSGVQDCRGS
jgi:choline dehydrogenase